MSEETSIEAFDYSKSEQYILSIRLNADGFSFSVFDSVRERFVYAATRGLNPALSFTANLKAVFKECDFLSCTFKRVFVLVVGRRYTFIPLELFDEAQQQTTFYYNFSATENETVCRTTLVSNSCEVLFGMDKSALAFLKECYPEAEYLSQASLLAEHFSQQTRTANTKQMYAYLRKDSLDLYCFDRGFMSLVNSYECKLEPDYAYYTLFVWKQLGMNQQTDELFLITDDDEQTELQQLLCRFVSKVSVVKPVTELGPLPGIRAEKIPFDMQALILQKAHAKG